MAIDITNHKCPACTGPLHFVGESGMLECDYCLNKYTVEEIEKLYAEKEEKARIKAEEKAAKAQVVADIEQLRIEFLGKKGYVAGLMQELRNVPNDQKKDAGQKINETKSIVDSTISLRRLSGALAR